MKRNANVSAAAADIGVDSDADEKHSPPNKPDRAVAVTSGGDGKSTPAPAAAATAAAAAGTDIASALPPAAGGKLRASHHHSHHPHSSAAAGAGATRGLKDVRVDSASDLTLLGRPTPLDEQRIQRAIEDKLLLQLSSAKQNKVFELGDALGLVRDGVKVIVQDDFNRCFESNPSEDWNFNGYLWVIWATGVLVRYFILFPLRLVSLLSGMVLFVLAFLFIKFTVKAQEKRRAIERKLIKFLCSVFVFSWTGVIRYHGTLPKHQPNQIYVANHTSMIDMIVLEQMNTFALVGQKHPGWVGLMQTSGLDALGNIWFNRGDDKERHVIPNRIRKHIEDPTATRLLIFPEGVCVNNEYCVQFKKTAFEIGAVVCPIAIKYKYTAERTHAKLLRLTAFGRMARSKIFVDAFWNSKAQSFTMHLVSLMCSWAVVCDVWYLEPQIQRHNESAIDFSNRVKKLIADTARLEDVQWDGYMKYFKPSARYVQSRQKVFADQLVQRINKNAAAAAADHHDNDATL